MESRRKRPILSCRQQTEQPAESQPKHQSPPLNPPILSMEDFPALQKERRNFTVCSAVDQKQQTVPKRQKINRKSGLKVTFGLTVSVPQVLIASPTACCSQEGSVATATESNTESAARPGPRPVARPGLKPAPRPGPRPMARPGPRPMARPEPRPVARPGPKPVARPGPRPVARPGPRPVARPGPRPVARLSPRPAVGPGQQITILARPRPQPGTEPRPEPLTRPGPRTKAQSMETPEPESTGTRVHGDTGARVHRDQSPWRHRSQSPPGPESMETPGPESIIGENLLSAEEQILQLKAIQAESTRQIADLSMDLCKERLKIRDASVTIEQMEAFLQEVRREKTETETCLVEQVNQNSQLKIELEKNSAASEGAAATVGGGEEPSGSRIKDGTL
uniref:Uncharacterized protein n=1 Tax=Amphiprion percula TaxID=161767 RepID=A0A3P8RHZ9_AMPPE